MPKATRASIQQQVIMAFARRGVRIADPDIIPVDLTTGEWKIGEAIRIAAGQRGTQDFRTLAADIEAELQPLYAFIQDPTAVASQ